MTEAVDYLIIGSGPAGVSCAHPLLEANKQVLMVDGGRQEKVTPPGIRYADERASSQTQQRWMLGQDYFAARLSGAGSPKLRSPTHAHVFEDYASANHVSALGTVICGSLAPGGLSNAWGAGVAALSDDELRPFPCIASDMRKSYGIVAKRIGISGRSTDDLRDYFGLDEWADDPVELDEANRLLSARYSAKRGRKPDFRLGRSRIAVLTRNTGGRLACDRLGNCFWGCAHKAIYSAADELPSLQKYPRFRYRPGFVVQRLVKAENGWTAISANGERIEARTVLLATGAIASTRLALTALREEGYEARERPVLSSPTAAFLLWQPRLFGRANDASFGLGQLSFTFALRGGTMGFGSTFALGLLPMAEFVEHMPLTSRHAIDVLRALSTSTQVGNVFLPGHLSEISARLDDAGKLLVTGSYREDVNVLLSEAASLLRRRFLSLGAVLIPGSFAAGPPGGDIHYSGSFPMRTNPAVGECFPDGSVRGLDSIHIIDGACLPVLTEKSHTLTLMANADRIGRILAADQNQRSPLS